MKRKLDDVARKLEMLYDAIRESRVGNIFSLRIILFCFFVVTRYFLRSYRRERCKVCMELLTPFKEVIIRNVFLYIPS